MNRKLQYVYSETLAKYADMNSAVKKRLTRLHNLMSSYGLIAEMDIIKPKPCTIKNLCNFHSKDYIRLYEDEMIDEYQGNRDKLFEGYGIGYDCPMWKGMQNYMCFIAGATMSACVELLKYDPSTQHAPIIVNWSGGWHHAKRDQAGGFCYVNDIVLGILILRKRFQRVLYIDLDVHHGNGVQEAFESTKRVFTLSFHQHESGFYPGTGSIGECGFGNAKGYAVNFPYRSGMVGKNYVRFFKRLTQQVLDRYKPDVIVTQCGADTIVGDPLGEANLTPTDLIECLSVVMQANLPTLILGGGGYNIANTCRTWTMLTAALCGRSLSNDIPEMCEDFLMYGPDYTLNIDKLAFRSDHNRIETLENTARVIENNLDKYNVTAV